jgi:hypothetical protein
VLITTADARLPPLAALSLSREAVGKPGTATAPTVPGNKSVSTLFQNG